MIITLASFKGGTGKTTSAVHLAAYFHQAGPTLLIDGDPNRSATAWGKRGELPFRVIDERQAAKHAREAEHIVIDTQARPDRDDLAALVEGCDELIIPTSPDALAIDALVLLTDELRALGATKYRVLLTLCPPRPSRDADEARAMLDGAGIPLFAGQIRRAVAFQKAALAGCVVNAVVDPRAAAAWSDYRAIGDEVKRNHDRKAK